MVVRQHGRRVSGALEFWFRPHNGALSLFPAHRRSGSALNSEVGAGMFRMSENFCVTRVKRLCKWTLAPVPESPPLNIPRRPIPATVLADYRGTVGTLTHASLALACTDDE